MPGKPASRKRHGSRGPCSYCNKVHRKGKKRGDSCRGHRPIVVAVPKIDSDGKKKDLVNQGKNKTGGNRGILAAHRARKREEAEARNAKTPVERTRKYRLAHG
jgi:hypothetical protein